MSNHHGAFKSAEESRRLLEEGNRRYVAGETHLGNVCYERRNETVDQGQSPYAVVIGCGDSRVPPEFLFNAGVGDLFVIRNAGHVIDAIEIGNIEYAIQHLNTKLVVVLGHTGCGAVQAAIDGGAIRNLQHITNHIADGLCGETDPCRAEEKNVRYGVKRIKENSFVQLYMREHGLEVVGGIYDTRSGAVRFLD